VRNPSYSFKLQNVTCHMGSRSVTCHLRQVNPPGHRALIPAR